MSSAGQPGAAIFPGWTVAPFSLSRFAAVSPFRPIRWPYVRAAVAALLALLATSSVAVADLARPETSVAALPLIIVPARATTTPAAGDVMVVLLSADGGWARLDQEVARNLSREGIPVVGWNTLSYYAHRRTPAQASRALAMVMRHYGTLWNRPRVLLVGYSFGADVLPLLYNRLPPELRAQVTGVALLGLSGDAEFEFHLQDWVERTVGPRYATLPEVRRIRGIPLLCAHGQADHTSVCERIGTPNTLLFVTRSGHSLGSVASPVSTQLLKEIHAMPRLDGDDR